jgi:anti-sigma-K factor RskA
MNDSGFDPAGFDNALRQRHAEAVTHISTRTHVQLRNRLAASTAAPRHVVRHRMAWAAATACAALFALAVGLQLRPQPMPAVSPATVVMDDSQADANAAYATLDENPDLYLWLASSDAVALASE